MSRVCPSPRTGNDNRGVNKPSSNLASTLHNPPNLGSWTVAPHTILLLI